MKNKQRELILETMETLLELQLKSVRKMLNKEEVAVGVVSRRGRRRKSLVDLSVELLTVEQHPIHVDELVELLMNRYGRVTDRDSLSSALTKKAKQGVFVRRVSPATFELLK
ncbi:MAG: hypothetical protein J7J70_03845 [Deltaproteobacteria bacterium]|nr:hypothetical protein [Candidatus Tharpellaceae bacterium]